MKRDSWPYEEANGEQVEVVNPIIPGVDLFACEEGIRLVDKWKAEDGKGKKSCRNCYRLFSDIAYCPQNDIEVPEAKDQSYADKCKWYNKRYTGKGKGDE